MTIKLKGSIRRVNVGTKENPVYVDRDVVSDGSSEFWQRVANGDTLVGEGGVDIDRAFRFVKRPKPKKNA